MNSIRRIASTFAALATISSAHIASAQAQSTETVNVEDCACVVPGGNTGQTIGSITGVTGTVMVSLPAGFSPATAGSPVSSGTRIIVGPQSQASLQIGPACRLEIEENKDVSLVALNGDLCVRVADGTGQTAGGNGVGARAAVVGLAAVGVPLAILAISP